MDQAAAHSEYTESMNVLAVDQLVLSDRVKHLSKLGMCWQALADKCNSIALDPVVATAQGTFLAGIGKRLCVRVIVIAF
jgi:hypothetical protein